ncbi:MAG: PrsW family intramembrane metalloprotease [Deltaproteobacteria bacterium]|nr:PrsW family intramembrane metalloprotease [Deltaproteobacteria bacterium]
MAPPRPHRPVPRLALAGAALVAIRPALWFARTLADVPRTIVLAAALPALLYVLAVRWIDRGEREPLPALAAAVVAGAVVAAWLSHAANARLLEWAATVASGAEARRLAAAFGAPLVEELAKALALLLVVALVRDRFAGALDGIVYGALVGIGFAFTENVVYLTFAVLQGGPAGLLRGVYVRALLGGGNHAAFTATTGAALGWALRRSPPGGPWLVPALGLAFAMLQHVIWNAVAASAIQGVLCGSELAGGPCRPVPTDTSLFVVVPALTLIFVAPGLVALGAIAFLAARSEKSA